MYRCPEFEGAQVTVHNVSVDPRYRRRGIMKELLHRLRDRYPASTLWGFTREANGPARALYRNLGAQETVVGDDASRVMIRHYPAGYVTPGADGGRTSNE